MIRSYRDPDGAVFHASCPARGQVNVMEWRTATVGQRSLRIGCTGMCCGCKTMGTFAFRDPVTGQRFPSTRP